jgi:hypothetical protein
VLEHPQRCGVPKEQHLLTVALGGKLLQETTHPHRIEPGQEYQPTQGGQILQEIEQLAVPFGGRVSPEGMGKECIHEDEQGK